MEGEMDAAKEGPRYVCINVTAVLLQIFIYVFIYVCMYVCMYVDMYACM